MPGEWGLRYVLYNKGAFIGILQSEGPHDLLEDWVDDLGWFTQAYEGRYFDVNDVPVFLYSENGFYFYFFIHQGCRHLSSARSKTKI